LIELLGQHSEYFNARGVVLDTRNGHSLDYDGIAGVLMMPDEQTPRSLIDDLFHIDEMASVDSMDALLDAASKQGVVLDVGSAPTPADVAVQVRLRAPELLEQKHAEQFLVRGKRAFEYFRCAPGVETTYRAPGAADRRAFEQSLGVRLDAMKRGSTCKLFVSHRTDGVWFLVRRGDPFKREGSIEKGVTTSVYYRPEKYDVIKYDQDVGELSVNAERNKKLVAHYRELFGVLLFEDEERFRDEPK